MEIVKTGKVLKEHIKNCKSAGKKIGFVPTMGFLHEGHLSLIRAAARENDLVVVSIFVNPTQFGPNEDYDQYPRDLQKDIPLAEAAGADLVFTPSIAEMYPEGFGTYIEVKGVTEKLCGASRPGFFRGVGTVVTKLFHLVEPDQAYFGQKDAQQAIVIRKMVRDLNMDVKIVVCPIVREADGLAMSSRNVYLNSEERCQALSLSQALFAAREMIMKGERDKDTVVNFIRQKIDLQPLAQIDYIEMINGENLEEIDHIAGKILIAVAVRFGRTRLIDNIFLEV